MNDYQMPLFDRYDISVEFDRHLALLKRYMAAHWDRFAPRDDIYYETENFIEICPLEIFPAEASLIDGVEEANDGFTLEVPYRGDDALWHLYPSKVLIGVLGEVFRGHLILTYTGQSEAEAKAFFNCRLAEIATVITQQEKRIELFEAMLPLMAKTEALKLRADNLSKFVGLQQ